jgi:hypothetical protein
MSAIKFSEFGFWNLEFRKIVVDLALHSRKRSESGAAAHFACARFELMGFAGFAEGTE